MGSVMYYNGWVVLKYIRKHANEAIKVKQVSSSPPWPLHQLLPPGSSLTSLDDRLQDIRWINPFSPSYFWSWCFFFFQSNRNSNEDRHLNCFQLLAIMNRTTVKMTKNLCSETETLGMPKPKVVQLGLIVD